MTDLSALPAFASDDHVNVVIESPRGSGSKFKYDPRHGVMTLSRPLTAGLMFPYDWGFIPSTHAPDGDPLDAIVMWDGVSYPGIVLVCRLVGVVRVEQANLKSRARERNDRIVALPVKTPRADVVHSVFDFSERDRRELEQFFLAAVALEKKDLTILGWAGPSDAAELVQRSRVTSTTPA